MNLIHLLKLISLGLFSITLLSGCLLLNSEEDVVKISPLPAVKNKFNPSIVWSASVGDGIGSFYSNLHPAFANNIVYAADRKGIVSAFSAADGKKIWSINLAKKNRWFSCTSALLSSGITIADGRIYIGSEKAQVYALNAINGSIVWQTNVAGEVLSHPVVSNGMVLVHTSNGQLQALNEVDGIIKWTISLIVTLDMPCLSLRGESAPATKFGTAIIGSDNGYVSAILIQQGQIIWQKRIAQATSTNEIARLSDVDITPIIIDNVIYALAYNGNLVALDLNSGNIIWKCELGSVTNFIVKDNCIYLVDQNDRLIALNIKDGLIIWIQNDLSHRLLTAPVIYNKNLVVGDREGYVHWVDLKTGSFIVQHRVDSSGFLTEPILTDDKLLIQAKDGKLYAIMH